VGPEIDQRVLEELLPAQRDAVLHGPGPLLIIAGAGTGKTTVLTRRIAHLIASKRAAPEQILALTFTEKAAIEMAERVDQLIPYGYAETRISTFHAFGDHVLREHAIEAGLSPGFRVLTRPEQIIFLRERLFELPLERFRPLGDPTRHLSALVALVSRAKDEDVSPEQYRDFALARQAAAQSDAERDSAAHHLELAAFFEAHQRLLAAAGLVDFGDQIFRTLRLLRSRPAVLDELRERYRYVLVDEFQDTNHAQLELLGLLASGAEASVTVVGDDDQAIYRWRGAASANLLAFRERFPGARQVVLSDNHRSTQPILDAASRLIEYNNPQRLEVIAGVDKRLRSSRAEGPSPRHLHFDTVSAEADAIAALVAERLQRGYRPRDLAVLVRSNADAEPYLRALNVKEIPHRFSGSRGLYAREEVRLLVCFLRLLANPDDSVSLFYLAASEPYRVPELELLRLNRYASRKSRPLLEVIQGLEENEELIGVGGAARAACAKLVRDVAEAAVGVAQMRTGELLYKYLQSSGLLARLAGQKSAAAEAKVKNIARFFELVKAYGELAEHDRVPAFVEHLGLLREAGDDPAVAEAEPDEDAVSVLTVHKAKGLEFPVVFLVGCAEGKFPVTRRREPLELPEELVRGAAAAADPQLQEERRLFFVAMTRAKDELVLASAADYGTARTRKVSRFVVESLDLPSPMPAPRRSQALEALARHQAAAEPTPGVREAVSRSGALRLSFRQLDDYRTCPLKYKYIHRLRVPLLVHHRIAFGSAVHKAVQQLFRARVSGIELSADGLAAALREAWISEGYLSREHEERSLAAGEEMLRRFHADERRDPWTPTGVEEEFSFMLGRTRVSGRFDLLIEAADHVTVLDFKTGTVAGPKQAERRARESLQLDIYALAYLETRRRLPDRVELRFLESGLAGAKRPTLEEAQRTREIIHEVARGVERGEFTARPSYLACGQCAFRDICPHTARAPEPD
jgi:DNA helicase-2/ATP-dependent DNA helicase PcrA